MYSFVHSMKVSVVQIFNPNDLQNIYIFWDHDDRMYILG